MTHLTPGAVRRSEAVQRAASRAVTQEAAAWFLASVAATHTDGTVDIATALGPVASVRRLKSYTSPVVNDVVMVTRNADGNWLVIGALATS
ncbi:hypothetical protein OG709_29890 [Streptomyces sp. NBC_01267]|uniref:hypothetical protein n=1 Tax=Streptomyces sp. NBC_01267 TaxID=2903805 RepID=UPI002E363C45|nr:hypothetical protein [Streptomyces sp. NBC_01267]